MLKADTIIILLCVLVFAVLNILLFIDRTRDRPYRAVAIEQEPLVLCNSPSPDGILRCRLDLGHGGWHSHHGPVSWYFDNWAEDTHRSNIPW